jgi:hypothetical protein
VLVDQNQNRWAKRAPRSAGRSSYAIRRTFARYRSMLHRRRDGLSAHHAQNLFVSHASLEMRASASGVTIENASVTARRIEKERIDFLPRKHGCADKDYGNEVSDVNHLQCPILRSQRQPGLLHVLAQRPLQGVCVICW